jgi:hypothetical protein
MKRSGYLPIYGVPENPRRFALSNRFPDKSDVAENRPGFVPLFAAPGICHPKSGIAFPGNASRAVP